MFHLHSLFTHFSVPRVRITPNYCFPRSPYVRLTWQTFLVYTSWKVCLSPVWPRQQYRALLIAMLISFIIKDRLCLPFCWLLGKRGMESGWFSAAAVWFSARVEQTGFIFCYWSAVNDLSLCFPFLKADEHGIIVVLHQDTDRSRVYWLFIKFRWGRGISMAGTMGAHMFAELLTQYSPLHGGWWDVCLLIVFSGWSETSKIEKNNICTNTKTKHFSHIIFWSVLQHEMLLFTDLIIIFVCLFDKCLHGLYQSWLFHCSTSSKNPNI